MSSDTQAILMIAAFLIPFVALIVFFVRFKARRRAAYESFAAQHGLEYHHSSWPMLTGKIDGRDFYMGLDRLRYSTGRAKGGAARSAAMLVAGIGINDVPEGLIVVRKGLIEKAMKSDVATNDAEFDKRALVKCPDPAAAAAYLTPERRAALVKLVAKKISLQDGELSFGPGSGKLSKLEHLEEFSKLFFDAAPILDGNASDNAAASAQSSAAATSAPAASYSGDAITGAGSDGAASINPVMVAAWMAATSLLLVYGVSWISGYFTVWFSMPLIVQVAIAGGVGFLAAMLGMDVTKPPLGAVVGVASWLIGSLAYGLFFWGISGAIYGWFSTHGILQIILAAASGVGMSFFLRKRSEGMDL